MKKLVSLLLACLILYNVLGYFIVFRSFQYAIKREVKRTIKNSLPDKDLVIIKLTAADISSGRYGYKKIDRNEFMLFSNMYDIVRSEERGDTIIFHCINDKMEQQLFANLNDHMKRHFDSNAPSRQKSNLLLKFIVKMAVLNKPFLSMPYASGFAYLFSNFCLPEYFYLNIPSPPPKQII